MNPLQQSTNYTKQTVIREESLVVIILSLSSLNIYFKESCELTHKKGKRINRFRRYLHSTQRFENYDFTPNNRNALVTGVSNFY